MNIEPGFDHKMNWFVAFSTLAGIVLCLYPGPGSVIVISGQGQKTDIKVLDRGDDQQCASVGIGVGR